MNNILDTLNDLPSTVEIPGLYIVDSAHGAKYFDAATHRAIGYILNPSAVTVEDSRKELEYHLMHRESDPFWIGDYIRQCQDLGADYEDIIPDEYDPRFSNISKLYKWASISRQYPDFAYRARYMRFLSYTHLAEVAYAPEPLREQLLNWAITNQVTTAQLRAKRNELNPDNHKGLNWISDNNAPILNDNSHTMVLDAETVNQVRLGNLRSLSSLFKQWRGVMQAGKRYEIVLREVRD